LNGVKILYYALGGGCGHAMRGLAVLRSALVKRPESQAALIAPSRFAAWARKEGVSIVCPPEKASQSRQALGGWVRRVFSDMSPDLTLVDVFPRGIFGELAPDLPKRPAWLVSRWIRPAYYLNPDVRRAIESCFNGILWCESSPTELSQLEIRQEMVGPALIRSREECLSREKARRLLGVDPDDRLVVVLGSGDMARQENFLRLMIKVCDKLKFNDYGRTKLLFVSRCLAERESQTVRVAALFPAVEYLPAADALTTAAGFNAFHEARMLKIPTVFTPQQRLYDDQFLRAEGCRVAGTPLELESALDELLQKPYGIASAQQGCADDYVKNWTTEDEGNGAYRAADFALASVSQ